ERRIPGGCRRAARHVHGLLRNRAAGAAGHPDAGTAHPHPAARRRAVPPGRDADRRPRRGRGRRQRHERVDTTPPASSRRRTGRPRWPASSLLAPSCTYLLLLAPARTCRECCVVRHDPRRALFYAEKPWILPHGSAFGPRGAAQGIVRGAAGWWVSRSPTTAVLGKVNEHAAQGWYTGCGTRRSLR